MYFMLKTVDDARLGTRYFLIIAKEKIDRIAKLRSFRSIAYADEVYPVAVQELSVPIGIGGTIFRRFLETLPSNVWMDGDVLRRFIDEFVKKLHEEFTAWLSSVASSQVPTAPKGRRKEKYPKVLYYGRYAPYRWRVVARLKSAARDVVEMDHNQSMYFFKRSFALDRNLDCMIFLPYDVSLVDAEKVYRYKHAIRYEFDTLMKTNRKFLDQLPENVRAVIDYVWLIAGTAGE
jgi:hypothetical protein